MSEEQTAKRPWRPQVEGICNDFELASKFCKADLLSIDRDSKMQAENNYLSDEEKRNEIEQTKIMIDCIFKIIFTCLFAYIYKAVFFDAKI